MLGLVPLEPVDYLVIGHVARDITPYGIRIGGTVAYSALTAHALGLRVGVVTAAGADMPLDIFNGISIVSLESQSSTTFENVYTQQERVQYVRGQASHIDLDRVPVEWRNTPIIHLGPIANEMDATLPGFFSPTLLGLTPQGWMRRWNSRGLVTTREWKRADGAIKKAGAVVISREDAGGDDVLIEHMAQQTAVLVVTEGAEGSVLYWHGDRRRFRALEVDEVDATGAGDIFATAFFVRLMSTRDPWEAARFATLLASHSVTRAGLDGIPSMQEIEQCMMVVIP